MEHRITMGAALALLSLVVAAPRARAEGHEQMAKGGSAHTMLQADQLKWGPAPPVFPKGAKMAVLQGDPGAAGDVVTVRFKMPKGYVIAPHFHPTDEAVTVVSGFFQMGMGDKVDRKRATTLKPGAMAVMPKGEHHYAVAVTPAVVQVHFIGPFALTYVNPEDDPQKQAAK